MSCQIKSNVSVGHLSYIKCDPWCLTDKIKVKEKCTNALVTVSFFSFIILLNLRQQLKCCVQRLPVGNDLGKLCPSGIQLELTTFSPIYFCWLCVTAIRPKYLYSRVGMGRRRCRFTFANMAVWSDQLGSDHKYWRSHGNFTLHDIWRWLAHGPFTWNRLGLKIHLSTKGKNLDAGSFIGAFQLLSESPLRFKKKKKRACS